MTTKKFTVEPESIEPVLALWFEYIHGQELDDKEVYWQRDKMDMLKEFEKAIVSDLKINLSHVFALFYADRIKDVPMFEMLENCLNQAGFYTYNSDTRFEIYRAEDVDLNDDEIKTCLESDEPLDLGFTIRFSNLKGFEIEAVRLNIIEHIEEEKRCEVFPETLKVTFI